MFFMSRFWSTRKSTRCPEAGDVQHLMPALAISDWEFFSKKHLGFDPEKKLNKKSAKIAEKVNCELFL